MNYLKELCEDLKIDTPLKKTERESYFLPLNQSLSIVVKDLNQGFFFFSTLCPCPSIKQEELFIQLMKANLFSQGTLGAVLAMAPDENYLTVSSALTYEMDYRTFKESLEDFANIVEYWREEVQRHVKQAQEGIL